MKHLSDNQLEISADQARARELSALQEMLHHLREIDRRKLFAKRGYMSLYDYAIQRFKYSPDEAHRRISAMRLLRDVPEIESKIANGSLQLTHLTQAQSFFRKIDSTKTVKLTKEEKLEVLEKLENTTKAQAKKVLYNEEVKARYSFEADRKLEAMVEELKGLHPHLHFDEVMRRVMEIAWNELSPAAKAKRMSAKLEKNQSRPQTTQNFRAGAENLSITRAEMKSRYIQENVKREVWFRSQGKCENCKSTYALQFDHIIPFAKGGTNTKENLRLLCRNCNQRKAIEDYGIKKIEQFSLQ